MPASSSFIEPIEGFYISLVLDFLYREGILSALCVAMSLEHIADERGMDSQILASLLDYVSARSDIVVRTPTGQRPEYSINGSEQTVRHLGHMLDQYVGAYGKYLLELPQISRGVQTRKLHFDAARHCQAFSQTERDDTRRSDIVRLLGQLEIGSLLDMGCGCGQLLMEAAEINPLLQGIGIDSNPAMVARANQIFAEMRLGDRLKVMEGDLLVTATEMPEDVRLKVDAITFMNVANAYCGNGDASFAELNNFFATLCDLFPKRLVIVFDYYGRLGRVYSEPENYKRTLLHDVVQILSGQGVPPKNLEEWSAIYEETSCSLLRAFEGTSDGIAWFIHVVQLAPATRSVHVK